MALSVDPKFKKWFESRKLAQKLNVGIPTRNANPTPKAGPKNSTTPKSNGAPRTTKKLATKSAVGRPKGKTRASN